MKRMFYMKRDGFIWKNEFLYETENLRGGNARDRGGNTRDRSGNARAPILRLTCLHFVRTAKFHMKTWLHLHFFRTTKFHMKIWLYLHFFRMAKFHMKTWLQLHFFRTTKFHMKTWLHYMLKGSNCFGVFHTWSFHPVCGRRLLWIQGPAWLNRRLVWVHQTAWSLTQKPMRSCTRSSCA